MTFPTRHGVRHLYWAFLFGLFADTASAQTAPRTARLLVTVIDPSGAVIPNATVTVTGQEAATKTAPVSPAKTTEAGVVAIDALAPGRYTIQAEFPGFETTTVKDVRVRAGDNKQVVTLPLKRFDDAVTVGRDPRESASDRGLLFGSALTREQISALSDDLDEMRRQLVELAGEDAIFKVDSFEGGQLPPKAQIKSIRIAKDQFAAESHYAGGVHIEIITQPGVGPLRASTNFRFSDGSLDGRNPFAPTKGPSQNKSMGLNLSGSLIKDRSSFSLSFNGTKSYTSPVLRAALPDGTRSEALNLRQPNDSAYGYGQWDYSLTKDQTIRVWFNMNRFTSKNQGIGSYDLPERGFWTEDRYWTVQLQETGPLGRRFFTNTRFSISRTDWDYHSHVEAPTIRVNDAFTSGGAQRTGGRRSWSWTLYSDLDYVRGRHSWRTGVALDGLQYQSDETQDYLGTYTFASLDDYTAGRPRSYTRRIGDPFVRYFNLQAGVYVQDDIRISKSLTLSPGVRFEVQTHLADYNSVSPRFGVTWSPFKSGKTTLRASAGIFHDWMSTYTYEQTLRIDGFRQQELNILDPSYPDPGLAGAIPPINRYLYSAVVRMPRTTRLSLGVQQAITSRIRAGAVYSDSRGDFLARGHNLNAPVFGVRPDPLFANIVEVISDAESTTRSLSSNVNVSLTPSGPAASQARFNWRRMSLNGSYTLSQGRGNGEGAFSIPASNDISTEWGPTSADVRHRMTIGVSSQALRSLNANLTFSGSSAGPYNIRTGFDDNGDLIFNDRPAGISRNSARGSGAWTLNGNFSYTLNFGRARVELPPGVSMTMMAGMVTTTTTGASSASRYRLTFSASISNLTNHHNLTGYSGVMTSPFFGRPQSASGVRRVSLSTSFSF
jgi:hypothetical protein